jgi:RNA polymerase sigma-70 factor, ECF subfamily
MTGLENQLIENLRNGDRNAFNQIYERYKMRVFRIAERYLNNQMNAEEVVQEVFFTVYRRIETFRQESSFETWLHRITVNACLMKIRTQKQVNKSGVSVDLASLENDLSSQRLSEMDEWGRLMLLNLSPSEKVYLTELWEALENAAKELGEDRWQTFFMSRIQGFSEEELAQKYGVGLAAIKSRLKRSRRFLQKKMAVWDNHDSTAGRA